MKDIRTMDSIDAMTACRDELFGLAGIISHLAEKRVGLSPLELDYLGSAIERIADDLQENIDIVYDYYLKTKASNQNDENGIT